MNEQQDGDRSLLADYLDEVELRLAFGEHPNQPPEEVWQYRVVAPAGWSERDFLRRLEEMLKDPTGLPFEYEVRTSRTVSSWGADTAALTIVAYITLRAIDTLVGLGVEGGIRGLIELLRSKQADEWRPVDRDTILNWAKARAAEAYDVEDDTLRLTAEEQRPDEDSWEFVFEDEGNRYTVAMGVVEGVPYSSRVRREVKG